MTEEVVNVNADGQQAEQKQEDDKQWLKERLDRAKESARRELLKEIGVDDPALIKESLKLAKELQESRMTETEKMRLEIDQLRLAAAKAQALETVVKANADGAFASLDDNHKSFVERIAGEDPAARLRVINELKALMPEAKPVFQPVTTAPEAPAPKAAATPQESLRQKYEELRARPSGTLDAAYMLLANPELLNGP